MTKHFCDRCGKDMTPQVVASFRHGEYISPYKVDIRLGDGLICWDMLCDGCAREIVRHLKKPGIVSDEESEPDDQTRILKRSRELGFDPDAYRCGCEVCSRTLQLCPASLSSLEDDVLIKEAVIKVLRG